MRLAVAFAWEIDCQPPITTPGEVSIRRSKDESKGENIPLLS
jgi:hypothetical protein